MPESTVALETLLPHDRPESPIARTLLLAIRRIGAAGLDDAHAANAMLAGFGMGYRRPLMFLRILMREMSRVANRTIAIAPCCCPRMTEGEAALLLAIDCGTDHPEMVRQSLARVTGSLDVAPALSVAQALADSLGDLGRPLRL